MSTREEIVEKYQGAAVAVYLRQELKPGAGVMATFCDQYPCLLSAAEALRSRGGGVEMIRAGGHLLSDDEVALLAFD
jgi:phage terminase small subunit